MSPYRQGPTRRRFLTIVAGAGAGLALGGAATAAPLARWQGVALGARATIALAHPDADRLIDAARAEIARLEGFFSLYRPDSALMRLNAEGALDAPPLELVELLSLARRIHRATGGAFDPSVQPLWTLHASHAAAGTRPGEHDIAAARKAIGFDAVRIAADRIAFDRPGMALTLNGIAQGFIADRVTALLAAEGLPGALVEAGEIRALGERPDGGAWPVGIADGTGGTARQIGLRDRALATSAPRGTLLDPEGQTGHIFDPATGLPAGRWQRVSVTARSAAVADGLSTGFCLMPAAAIEAALTHFPDARLEHLA